MPEGQRDPDLVEKLCRELPGILNRLVRAGADYVTGRISTPDVVLKATAGYFFEKDNVAAYLAERVEVRPDSTTSKGYLYEDYAKWCKAECLPPLSRRELTRVLRKKGYEEGRNNSARCWKNLWVAPDANWAQCEEPEVDIPALMTEAANTA